MYQRNPLRYPTRNAVRNGLFPPTQWCESNAQSSGTSPHQAKIERQGGIGPASGNGNSSRAAVRTAAPHIIQVFCFIEIGVRIQRRVYRIPMNQILLNSLSAKPTCLPFRFSSARIFPLGLCQKTRYNPHMDLATKLAVFAMHLLEVLFFAGLVGSSVVVIISFIEDGKELFGKDEE
jgi:hypothetical protein